MIPLPGRSKAVQDFTRDKTKYLRVEELTTFMRSHGFSDKGLAEFLGVTLQAVRAWKRDQRSISMTTSKVIRLMIKYPHLMQEF